MGDSIPGVVFSLFAIYFACLYEFFVDMPVFFTSFFSVNFIFSMSDGFFTANAGLRRLILYSSNNYRKSFVISFTR